MSLLDIGHNSMTAIRGIFLLIIFILVQTGNGEECTKVINDHQYSCQGKNLTYIPTSIPYFVETLDFSFNFLPSLQKHLFPPLYDLQLLDLTRCQTQYIADDGFHNVKNVTVLILTGNPISSAAPESLNSLHKLQRLLLTDIGLLSLNVQFHNLTKLQELKAGTNKIQTIALPQFMISFTDFCLLDLHANNISSLMLDHTAVLREMRGNITLILSSNPILYIEPGVFKDIFLKELNIRSAFASLDAMQYGLQALRGLSVGKLIMGNYYEEKKISGPDYLHDLCWINFKEVYFFQRVYSDFEINVFYCMVNATKITLKQSNIVNLPNVPLNQLKELYIHQSQSPLILKLSHLPLLEVLVVQSNSVFLHGLSDLPNLQHVDLNRNKLSLYDCCSNYFTGIPNIHTLNLSFNEVLVPAKNPFSGLGSMKVLDIQQTRIKSLNLQFKSFKTLKYLQYLDISYTHSTFLRTMDLSYLSSLKVLKMEGNSFQGDAVNYIFKNMTTLEVLQISNCGIKRIELRAFQSLYRLRHLFLNQNKLMVLDFVTHPNLKGLTLLDVGKNSIFSILPHILQNLPTNLSALDLSFNPLECSCSQIDFIIWVANHQQLLQHSTNVLCEKFTPESNSRVMDFDFESCGHIRRLTIVLCVCIVSFLVFVSVLAYRFQFYLQYGCILLRGYKVSRQQECSYDAFVIYSSKDESWVMNELVKNLEGGTPPIQLCLHVRDFEPGKAITSNIIDEGIMNSHKIIVVVSKHFIESSWCRFEFEVAQSWLMIQGNANIIIIILEDVEEEKSRKVFGLHKHLKNNTYLKWSGNLINNTRFWIRLRKAVSARK